MTAESAETECEHSSHVMDNKEKILPFSTAGPDEVPLLLGRQGKFWVIHAIN